MPHPDHPLSERKLAALCPWAWTPQSIAQANQLKKTEAWHPDAAEIYSKAWAGELLRSWQPDAPTLGCLIHNEAGLRTALQKFGLLGWANAIIKPNLGTAGHAQRRLPCAGNLAATDHDVLNKLYPQGVWVEPELDRLLDITFQWDLKSDGSMPFLGWTRQQVTPGRRYAGTIIGQPFADISPELKRYLLADRHQRLHDVVDELGKRLQPALTAHHHRGPFGVDAMVYRDHAGDLQIKSLGEINPRRTMGQVALALEQQLAPGRRGEFCLLTKQQIKKEGFRTFADYAAAAQASNPMSLNDQQRIISGTMVLADAQTTKRLLPLLHVGQ